MLLLNTHAADACFCPLGTGPGEKGGAWEPGPDPAMEPKGEKTAQAGDGESCSRVVSGFHTA